MKPHKLRELKKLRWKVRGGFEEEHKNEKANITKNLENLRIYNEEYKFINKNSDSFVEMDSIEYPTKYYSY